METFKAATFLSRVSRTFAAAVLLASLCGCASARSASKSRSSSKASASRPSAEQKKAYDRGMKFYTQEQYKEARKAWQEAVRMGPSTPTGKQAQEYLKDVERTIRTLEGIKGQ